MAKKKAPKNAPPAAAWVAAVARQPRVFAGVGLLALLAWGGVLSWRHAEHALRDDPLYRVTADTISVPPPPPWVRSDVKRQALSNAGLLGGLSVLDPPEKLQARLADAFRYHPWVKSVASVTKLPPNRVQIELTYCRPLAAVEVEPATLLPVDEDAIRLPERDLTEAELRRLPRVAGLASRPSLVGEVWSDPRVLGAISLVSKLGAEWGNFSFTRVTPSQNPTVRGEAQFYEFALETSGGTRVVWGAAPLAPAPDQAPFDAKLARLRAYVSEHGPLTSMASPGEIDLRYGLEARPRLVKREKPASGSKEVLR